MRAYSSMPCDEFIDAMRDSAIRSNAAPAIIDAIDSLQNVDQLERELEEANGECSTMEHARDRFRDSLADLVQALPDDLIDALIYPRTWRLS